MNKLTVELNLLISAWEAEAARLEGSANFDILAGGLAMESQAWVYRQAAEALRRLLEAGNKREE